MRKIVYYRKERAVYKVEIEGLDDEEEVWVIRNLIKDFSINRRVFVEISGDISAIDKKL